MSTFSEMQERLQVTDGKLYWRARGRAPKQAAGNRHGDGKRLKFNCVDYLKESVVLALTLRDERLLEVVTKKTKAAPKSAPKAVPEVTDLTHDDGFVAREARYAAAAKALEEAKAALLEAKQELTAFATEGTVQGISFKISKLRRKGSVSYSRVVKEHLPSLDLSAYRGKPVEYYTVREIAKEAAC
jgi:hypothetical protein